MICPSCNFENPGQFKFCGECGTKIVDIVPEVPSELNKHGISTSTSTDYHPVDAERRHITVMFCDMVGSTQLSEQLDPEDFRQILHVYQDTCVYVVNQFEGHLAQYLGDGVLIYFGYPEAHEDDSQRAIRCGLEILSELECLNELQTQFKGINLAVRIGIHTGLVVVGEVGRDRRSGRLALGNTPNIAARLQALADPNTIVISQKTYRLVKNFFECQSLGTYTLKGVSHKKNIFKVIKEIETAYSFKTINTTGMTSFVGRENEIQNLLATWGNVKENNGNVVLITGEPGIGKTRLLRFFEERIKDEPHTWLVCRCISYYKNSAFYPIINLLNSQLRFGKNDSNEEKLSKLEEALSNYDFDIKETLPIIASLLSIPISKPDYTLHITPQKQKEKTIQILLDWLIMTAKRNPLLFVIEDAHWADSSTLEHLTLLMEKIEKAPILIILTSHPRFNPPLNEQSRLTEISLNRLTSEQIEHMVQEVTGGKIMPPEVLKLLVMKTDGVPLFVEELIKMLVVSNHLVEKENRYDLKDSLLKPAIPDTLQDTLMARLDQLGAEREVVQIAAVVGREFSFELIRSVISLDEAILKKELNSLVEADILEIKDDAKNKVYIFRQVLIQDAAYNSILNSMRRKLHSKIAGVLEREFREFVQSHPQIVAYHYTRAKDFKRAIDYHLKSGILLEHQSAHREAISQIQKGLSLLEHISDEKKRNKLELDLQITMGVSLLATKGYGAEEVGKVYERARDLSQRVGDIPQLFPALVGQYRFYLLRGDLEKALDISELLLSWAQTSQDSSLLLEATRSVGVCLFHMGELATGLEQLEKGIDLYVPADHSNHAHVYGTDPLVSCLSYGALSQCLLGNVEKALQYGKKALQHAKSLKHPFSLVFALNHHCWLHQFYKETEVVEKFANELITISADYGFPFWQISGMYFKGWVLSQSDNTGVGTEKMAQSIKAFQGTGAGSVLPYFMTALAEVYLENNQLKDAFKWLENAEVIAQKNCEHFFDTEIYRVRGEVLFKSNQKNKKNAESLLWRAIETARRQKLKALELRAGMSLVRIVGPGKETLKLLNETYKWFTEGFGTHDLKQAKNLLKQIT